ncbi:MAG: hypothetical protein ACFFD4_35790 [Candidatus Odinarchaeota archaeon]
MSTRNEEKNNQKLFNHQNVRYYIIVILAIVSIIGIYYLISPVKTFPSDNPVGKFPPNGILPGIIPGNTQPPQIGFVPDQYDLWPLWVELSFPAITEILPAILVLSASLAFILHVMRKQRWNVRLFSLVAGGIALIIGTNLIHGWQAGIEAPIGGPLEIFSDAIKIDNIISFISNYEYLQSSLSVHAQTQPPGAVTIIYLLYVVFGTPSLIAISLCIIASFLSAYFIYGIFTRFFDEDLSKYTVFLYLLLPAVQVYYLANIYAIVASLVLGVIHFYLHPDKKISIIGSLACFFLGTFISFLFIYTGLLLFLFEVLRVWYQRKLHQTSIKNEGGFTWVNALMSSFQKLTIIATGLAVFYGLVFFISGFNYINAFLYASNLENPGGFMLLTNTLQYFITRIQNVLDILIFFGPILIVLCYRGLNILKEEAHVDTVASQKYLLVLSAIGALLLLFLTGTPKKGETARICLFILPFLLIPVTEYLEKEKPANMEKNILLLVVFGQAVVMQLIGTYVW